MPQNSAIQLKAQELLEAGKANVFSKNYYSSIAQYEVARINWYVEGPSVIVNTVGVNTSSINTNEIDQFRQGVEITQNKHTLGLVKISAGSPGHFVKPLCYGVSEDDLVSTDSYLELDKFDPLSYIASQEKEFFPENTLTFPISVMDIDEVDFNFNSIIEPLPIRKVADFKSLDFPYEYRSFKGTFGNGNSEPFNLSNDQVVSVDYWKPTENTSWFLDSFGYLDVSGSLDQSVGYVNGNLNKIESFDDSKVYIDLLGITSEKSGNDMYRLLSIMSTVRRGRFRKVDTSNYVSPKKKSATSGFVFDNSSYSGTDSIAFGGLSY